MSLKNSPTAIKHAVFLFQIEVGEEGEILVSHDPLEGLGLLSLELEAWGVPKAL